MSLQRRSFAARSGDTRMLSAPFEFAVSLLFIITSLGLVKQLLDLPPIYPHVGLMAYPLWLLWGWAASVGTGGLAILTGLIVGPYMRLGRGVEKAGLWLAGTSWFSIFLADAWTEFRNPLSWMSYLAIVLGCGLRLYALHKIEHAVKVVTEDATANGLDSER